MSEQVPVFQNLFEQSQGKPITYKGREVAIYDRIEVAANEVLTLF